MTPINVQDLLKRGFKQVREFTFYCLDVNLPYPCTRRICANLHPHDKWIAYYEVSGVPASRVLKTIEDIDTLYLGVTGEELKQTV